MFFAAGGIRERRHRGVPGGQTWQTLLHWSQLPTPGWTHRHRRNHWVSSSCLDWMVAGVVILCVCFGIICLRTGVQLEVRWFPLWKVAEMERTKVGSKGGCRQRWEKSGVREREAKYVQMERRWTAQGQEGRERRDWMLTTDELGGIERVIGEEKRTGGVSEERSWKMRSERGWETTGMKQRERIMKNINSLLLHRWPVRFAQLKQHRWVSNECAHTICKHKTHAGTGVMALQSESEP